VRGLNSGFDDADNLAWKLAAVVAGRGGEALLDSYSSERVQAFHVNAESAMRSTEFMSPPHRGFELMREACLSLAGRHKGIARLVNPRQTHAIAYVGSPLSSGDESAGHGPVLGAPLLDGPVGDDLFLTDLLADQGFTLLAFGACAVGQEIEAITQSPQWRFLPCRCVLLDAAQCQALADRYDTTTGTVCLVRPDGHLCGRWRAPQAATVLAAIRLACGEEGALA
jgi:3-(3-hydroxy-phenyl)propionate hydroxylase